VRIIAGTIKYTVLIIVFITLFQVGSSYMVYKDWYKVEVGQSRDEVHGMLGQPNQAWVKSDEVDWWSSNILLGGIKLSVSYSGEGCRTRHLGCKVSGLHKQYFTLWDNHWFLYFYLG